MSDDKHKGCERGFTIQSEAWYREAVKLDETADEIMVGMYHLEGGTTGEFGIRWLTVGREPTPRLEVFSDAWHALSCFGDLLTWMASVDGQNVTPKQVAEALRQMGIRDMTSRVNPYSAPGEQEYASWLKA